MPKARPWRFAGAAGVAVALVVAALVAGPASGAHAAGQSPDLSAWRSINSALATLAGDQAAGLDGTARALQAIRSQVMLTPAGQAYQRAALLFAAGQAAADACIEIVESNPSIAGVNEFLVCIGPINAVVVAQAQAMSDAETDIVANTSPVVGPGPPASLGGAAAVLGYATTIGLTSDIASAATDLKDLAGLGKDIIQVGPKGVLAVTLPDGVTYADDAAGKVAVVFAFDEENVTELATELVTNEQLGSAVQQLLGAPQPSPAVAAPFAGGIAGAQERALRAAGASRPRGVTVAVAPPGTPVSVLFAPPWSRDFAAALRLGRTAEEGAIANLVGASPRARPKGRAVVRLRGDPGLSLGDARALEAVLANQAARARQMTALNATLRRADRARGAQWRRLQTRAAAIAHRAAALYRAEPRLRHAAIAALRPPPERRRRTVAVVSAPAVLRLDVPALLRDPARDRASRALARALAQM